MTKNPQTRAREVSEYRREFRLSDEQVLRLRAAIVSDAMGDDETRPAVTALWFEFGQELGFIWTTVEGLVVPSDGAATFTAEVPDVLPAREYREAGAAVKALLALSEAPEPEGDEMETWLADIGRWAAHLAMDAWHAGHDAGLQVGVAMGRMEPVEQPATDDQIEELVTEAVAIGRSVDAFPSLRAGMLLNRLAMVARTERQRAKQQAFTADQRWEADMRAIKRWQAGEPDPHVRAVVEAASFVIDIHHGGKCYLAGTPELRDALNALPATWREPAESRELMWPDHADLVCWLLAKVEAMEAVPLDPLPGAVEEFAQAVRKCWFLGPKSLAQVADRLDGLGRIIAAQARKIASLRLQGNGPGIGEVMASESRRMRDWVGSGDAWDPGRDMAKSQPCSPPRPHSWKPDLSPGAGEGFMTCHDCGAAGMLVEPGPFGNRRARSLGRIPLRRTGQIEA